jgi:hypothetical protein
VVGTHNYGRRILRKWRTEQEDIVQWAAPAAEAAMAAARLVEVPGASANSFTTIRDSVTNCLDLMTRAVEVDDAEGLLSRGELVGDAVANFAALLKGSGS